MGLDKDDTIVKRRMAQKMQFLAEDVAAAHEPTTAELKAWFEKNSDKFALPGRVSFRHLYFSPDRRGARARDDAAAGAREARRPAGGLEARRRRSPIRSCSRTTTRDRAPEQLAKEFGPQFALAVAEAQARLVAGADRVRLRLASGVRRHRRFPGRVPAFEEVEPDVKTAWLGEQKAQAWRQGVRGDAREVHGAAARAARRDRRAPRRAADARSPASSGEAPQ